MTQQFKSIAIIGKYMNQQALQQMRVDLTNLALHLSAKGIDVWVEENTAQHAELSGFKTAPLISIGKNVDLAIVMGGDGTMLSVARSIVDHNIPIVGINRGRFGFLTDLRAEDMLQSVDRILSNRYQIESRMLLSARVIRGGKTMYKGLAFNDVVIKGGLRLIEMTVEINGNFVHKLRADGLILSTPTGTTAYSLSAGGPILHPSLEAIAMVPVSPHTLSNRPIAVNSSSLIQITLIESDDGQVSFDGQFQMLLESGDSILIQRAEKQVKLLHPSEYCYFDMLRDKLNWG